MNYNDMTQAQAVALDAAEEAEALVGAWGGTPEEALWLLDAYIVALRAAFDYQLAHRSIIELSNTERAALGAIEGLRDADHG